MNIIYLDLERCKRLGKQMTLKEYAKIHKRNVMNKHRDTVNNTTNKWNNREF